MITLVFMNMLIAIMSDSYEKVQATAMAADARIKCQLILEAEETLNFMFRCCLHSNENDSGSVCC